MVPTNSQDYEPGPSQEKKERTDNISMRSINSSFNRTKNNIHDLVRSNSWDWFITLTFDKEKVDRTDYDLLLKKVQNWFTVLRRKSPNLKYILVPEIHKRLEDNGKHAWHFHGLIADCPELNVIPSINKNGKRRITKSGIERFEISDYKLGFSDATPVQYTFKCSTYILKYITKSECCLAKNKRRYIYSQNLNKPVITEYYYDRNNPFEEIFNNAAYVKSKEVLIGEYKQKVTYYHFDS